MRRARPLRGGRGRLPRHRAADPAAGGVPRATSSATSSTATASWSRSPSAGAPRSMRSPATRCSSSTPTTRRSATWRATARAASPSASTTPSQARPSLQHAADSKYCLRCGTPYAYAAAYVGHLGDYRCPACGHGRPPLQISARSVELARARGDLVRPRPAGGNAPRPDRPSRPLQRLQRARRGGARPGAGRLARRDRDRPRRPPGPRSAASSGSTSATARVLLLLVKNPAGANEVVRTLVAAGAPQVARARAERRDRRRPRRLVDLGRRLRAALRGRRAARAHRRPRRRARAAVHLRRPGRIGDRGRARPRGAASTAASSSSGRAAS